MLDAVEEIGECFLTCLDILGRLTDIVVENPFAKGTGKMLTIKRTPIPAEITWAGENICEND